MLHIQQIDVPSVSSHAAAVEKLEGLASGATAPDARTTAACGPRRLGAADHVTWCPGSSQDRRIPSMLFQG